MNELNEILQWKLQSLSKLDIETVLDVSVLHNLSFVYI